MVKISAVILTFNEETNIARCIKSVLAVADEILIVDSFSTDRTEEISRSFNVKFIRHPFGGYIEQKNYATSQAAFDHVLSLDADEELSEELINSILTIKKEDWMLDGYTMNRLSNYCGKWIHHSGWYPDVKLRLFNRTKGKWGGFNPHDKYELTDIYECEHLIGNLHHYSYYTIDEHRKQIEKFSSIAANALYEQGVRSNELKLIYKPVARFLRTYVVKKGFLDGREGFTIAKLTAWSSWLRYKKLYEIQNQAV